MGKRSASQLGGAGMVHMPATVELHRLTLLYSRHAYLGRDLHIAPNMLSYCIAAALR